MSAHNPVASLPLFAQPVRTVEWTEGTTRFASVVLPPIHEMVAAERGKRDGQIAAPRMPDWLVAQAEQAIERFRGKGPFSSESVRACLSPAAEAWLAVKTRANVWPGFWRGCIRRFDLRPTGLSVESQREGARGRRVATYLLPS